MVYASFFIHLHQESREELIMEGAIFNDVQMHILQMFSYSPSSQEVNELKDVLARYYAERVQKEADALWDEGTLGEEAIEGILKEHLRIPSKR